MRIYGFTDELIVAALVNAYAESDLNVRAVGLEGEMGIFQLHPRGLGRGMTPAQMRDIGSSVDRISQTLLGNERIMRLMANGASATELTAAFCIEIERPSARQREARYRTRLLEKMLIN